MLAGWGAFARPHHLFGVDRLLDDRRAAPAVLARPRHACPAAFVQLALPATAVLERLVGIFGFRAGMVGLEPRTQLVAELLLGR